MTSRWPAPSGQDRPDGRRRLHRGEAGTTLIEVMVCVALLGLLGSVIFPIVASFTGISASVQGTYDTVDHLIEPSNILARLLHEAVAPAPAGSTTAPWSVFTTNSGPLELQFTADVGSYGTPADAGHFTAYGPALVTVALQSAGSSKPALVATIAAAVAGTCPGTSGTGDACQWNLAQQQQLFSIPDFTYDVSVFSYIETGGAITTAPAASPCTDSENELSCPLDQVTAVAFTFNSQRYAALAGTTQSEAALLAPAYDPNLG